MKYLPLFYQYIALFTLIGSGYFKPSRNLKLGLLCIGKIQDTGNFIFWENISLGYKAQGMASMLSYQKSLRVYRLYIHPVSHNNQNTPINFLIPAQTC